MLGHYHNVICAQKVRMALIEKTALFTATVTVAAALSNPQPATAGVERETCSRVGDQWTCTLRWDDGDRGFPKVIYVPYQDRREAADWEKTWLARCRPVIRRDRYGIGRYIYAAPGCEFGKSED